MPIPVKVGKKERRTFSKIREVSEMPNLIDIQTKSYKWFLEEGLREVFDDISPIKDYANNLALEFVDYKLSDELKYGQEECKERDVTYAAPLKVQVRLTNNVNGEVKTADIFMGDFPLMTEKGTFIYNGAERVVVTQLVRSPGAYYSVETDKNDRKLYSAQIIPNRGAWLEYETDPYEVLNVRVDRTRKLPLTTLLKAFGFNGLILDEDILAKFVPEGEVNERLDNTLAKGQYKPKEGEVTERKPEDEARFEYQRSVQEVYSKLRPGELPTVESARVHLTSLYFDSKRYDIAKVGRYKFNKKLGLAERIVDVVIAEDIIDPLTGEILAEANETISREKAREIEDAGVEYVIAYPLHDDAHERRVKIIGNRFVPVKNYVKFDVSDLRIPERVHYPVLMEILSENKKKDDIRAQLVARKDELSPKHIIQDDIVSSISCSLVM